MSQMQADIRRLWNQLEVYKSTPLVYVVVSDLCPLTTEDDLKATFEKYGPVIFTTVVKDRKYYRKTKTGLIQMGDEESAQNATSLSKQYIMGHKCNVKLGLATFSENLSMLESGDLRDQHNTRDKICWNIDCNYGLSSSSLSADIDESSSSLSSESLKIYEMLAQSQHGLNIEEPELSLDEYFQNFDSTYYSNSETNEHDVNEREETYDENFFYLSIITFNNFIESSSEDILGIRANVKIIANIVLWAPFFDSEIFDILRDNLPNHLTLAPFGTLCRYGNYMPNLCSLEGGFLYEMEALYDRTL